MVVALLPDEVVKSMLRIALIDILMFALPFLLYGAYVLATRGTARTAASAGLWQGAPVLWLLVGGRRASPYHHGDADLVLRRQARRHLSPSEFAERGRQAGRDRLTATPMGEQTRERALELPSLKDAAWLEREETQAVFDALQGHGIETRAVGGAVRNTLLGLAVTEIDLATTAVPEEVMALAAKAGLKAVPTGIDHGTVTLVASGVPFEVTTLRRDVETFGRHARIAYTKDWKEDARRRDFTLNALYADRDGQVFDPLGGYADLRAGQVRFIGDAEERIKEDYLRILRFFRVHAYYGKGPLDPAGLAAAVRLRGGLDQLSAERVGAELRRILIAPQAAGAVKALYDYGLLTGLLGGVPRLADFMRLIAIESALGRAPETSLRLAVLAVFVEEDVERLTQRFRLSNAEQTGARAGVDGKSRHSPPR